MLATADFETTTLTSDCRVWAGGICEIGNPNNFVYFNNIDDFMYYCEHSENSTFYFHNLKFDGEFILYWLFENGFTHVLERQELESKTFMTLISNKGQFYSFKIVFKKQGKHSNTVSIFDSLKILPFSVKDIAKGFDLPISKLEIDYKETREIGHELTEQEKDYLRNDVDIVARALDTMFEQGLTKMTQGSNALYDYKKIAGKNFEKWFPIPQYDADVRRSYKGGFTYLSPRFKEKDIGEGIVLDVNSLYPSVMYYQPLPYGEGIFFNGRYKEDKLYNLYVQMFTCNFELKKDYIPTLQLKNNLSFIPTEYLTSSNGEDVTLCLTSVDLMLFFDHYNVYNIEYHSGWKFKSTTELFREYIDKWVKVKNEATISGNKAMRSLAKLMLNALYGKFSLNPEVQSKIPFYEDGMVKYKLGEKEYRNPIYIPVGTFITAWARYKTITSAQKVYDRFVYADTDSLHLVGLEMPDLEIDIVELGKWKHESSFKRARFLRQKTYMETESITQKEYDKMEKEELEKVYFKKFNGKWYKCINKITCAGMPDKCYQYVNWDNFQIGERYLGKLYPKHVKGGIVLLDGEFTIKR